MSVSGAVNQNQEYGLVLIHFPMRGATRHAEQQQRLQRISIRAPREGSDDSEADQILCEDDFNPRSPRGERHHIRAVQQPRPAVFQSTLPARGATPDQPGGGYRAPFQSTLPARGATGREHSQPDIADISIHAPREGSDHTIGRPSRRAIRFQSTLPARGATQEENLIELNFNISIHAPREGSDPGTELRGEDHHISIHAPREGSDQ